MKALFRGLMVLVCAATLAGCADMVTGGPLVRPGEPTGTLEVINRTNRTLSAVLISNCSASTYGLNRLPSGASIPPGRSWRFTVSAGCWDVNAGTAAGAQTRIRTSVRAGGVMQLSIVD